IADAAVFFFSSRRRHTRSKRDWSSDVCSSDLGRVQTVALRLIVEREQQIRAFLPQEYWTIHAMLDAGPPPLFEAKLFKHNGEDIEVKNQEAAEKIVAAVSKAKWLVASVTQKEKKRNQPPPFTTSKLQQAAYNRLRYTAKRDRKSVV